MSAMKNKNNYKLHLAVQYGSTAQDMPSRAQFRRWTQASMERDFSVTLRIVDEPEGRELNKNYRHRDYATNVLTFVYDDSDPLQADVVICAPVIAREAAEQQKDLKAHYAHMTIHAMLHLQGYDHETAAEADKMEALESSLMIKLHYPDPYQEI